MVILKPSKRESILLFGDGDEAVFDHVSRSSEKGYLLFFFRPTDKMRWTKQIQYDQYDEYDHMVKKIYKEELCIPLSLDPDFPFWAILCDYNGKEDTPLFNVFKQDKLRIRELQNEVIIWKTKSIITNVREKKRAQNPEGYEMEMTDRIERMKKAFGSITILPPQQDEFKQQEEG